MPVLNLESAFRTWVAFGLLAIFLLFGCAYVEPPKVVDIYDGVFVAKPKPSISRTVPGGPSKSIGVILSENTRRNIDFLKAVHDKVDAGSAFEVFDGGQYQRAMAELTDPSFNVKWVAGSLKRRYGKVSILEQLDPNAAQRYDALAIVDLIVLLEGGCAKSNMRIVLLDSRLAIVGEAIGADSHCAGLSLAPAVVQAVNYQKAKIRALEMLDREFAKLVVLTKDEPIASAAGDSPAASNEKEFEKCMERAVAVKDSRVRVQAMAACDQLR